MVRLTADLVSKSIMFINPVKDRELDMRGWKIPAMENLASTQDQFDTFDLSDNEIRKLECTFCLKRLKTLLMSNNRINRIQEDVGTFLPNLETLIFTNNQFTQLSELDAIESLASLRYVTFMDNKVTKKQNYRSYVIAKLPNLKVLDFQKVKPKERQLAKKLFGAAKKKKAETPAESAPAKTFEPGKAEPAKAGPSQEQIATIKAMIANATSLEEVAKLEKALKSGNFEAVLGPAKPAEGEEPKPMDQ